MPGLTFLQQDGTEHTVTIRSGTTVMAGAVREGIPGIDAECGGACACATCCVTIPDDWVEAIPPPDAVESALLEASPHFGPALRLACQIVMTPALDGLTVQVPGRQRL